MNDNKQTRKPLRLKNYDYSSKLTVFGQLAKETITEITVRDYITVDNYVIMPNHIHLLITLSSPIPDRGKPCHYDIPQIVGKYKSLVARKWLAVCQSQNRQMGQIWQRSYHDHIIRCEKDYLDIWNYIDENPMKWEIDKYYK